MEQKGEPDAREPKLARRSPFAPEVKLCPKCLSPVRSTNKDLMGFVPPEYYCQKCGYTGMVYVVKDKEEVKAGDERGTG
ncbi:MAG: hypothetical protein JRM80_14025 [Nitrososphaerota archaeon]|nr:hypothetical protein [Nitrososphaerota archaeon]MDG6991081.1 hypothetical protein [Nitrososphaerota archaeon]